MSVNFKENFEINKINEIIEFSNLYLIDYFEDLKTKIDIEFVKKINETKDSNLNEETNKKWSKIIDLIEKSQFKCLKNKFSNEMICETKERLDKIGSNKSEFLKIKNKLDCFLLSNDSNISIFIQIKDVIIHDKILIIEEGLNPTEIGYLINKYKL